MEGERGDGKNNRRTARAMSGGVARYRQLLWSVGLLPAVLGKFFFSKTAFIWLSESVKTVHLSVVFVCMHVLKGKSSR